MAYRYKSDLSFKDVSSEAIFLNRRQLCLGAGAMLSGNIWGQANGAVFSTLDEKPNSFEQITNYNNYYEFGTGKGDPAKYAGVLKTKPWSIKIDGLVDNPMTISMPDLLKEMIIEERIYRFRCVEGWSMVVPWNLSLIHI